MTRHNVARVPISGGGPLISPYQQDDGAIIHAAEDFTVKGYNIIYGFRRFSDFSRHPRRVVCAGGYCSSAAGRYQFLDKTWNLLQRNLSSAGFNPFPKFTPEYQDQAALYLIDWKQRVMDEIDRGDFVGFLRQGCKEWASLPDPRTGRSFYDQPTAFSVTGGERIFKQLFDLWNA
ncbi:MAG: glycoside hydrolase family 104 protein [Moorea sp. SIO2B7]|nr:glycoside hydrolase family 104 protein [Moorena sp. SIO2B7]